MDLPENRYFKEPSPELEKYIQERVKLYRPERKPSPSRITSFRWITTRFIALMVKVGTFLIAMAFVTLISLAVYYQSYWAIAILMLMLLSDINSIRVSRSASQQNSNQNSQNSSSSTSPALKWFDSENPEPM